LQRFANRIAAASGKKKAYAAAGLAVSYFFCQSGVSRRSQRDEFGQQETLKAEKLLADVWETSSAEFT